MTDWTDQVVDKDGEREMPESALELAPDAISHEEAKDREYKWRILVWGEPRVGKTHFCYTAPPPVAFIDTEGKGDSISHKFEFDDDKFAMWQPDDYDEAMKALDQALSFLEYWKEKGEIGSLVVDSISIMWEWSKQKYVEDFYPGRDIDDVNLTSGFGGSNSDWKIIKKYHNKDFRQPMLDSDFNLIWTAMAEEDYSRKLEEGLPYAPDKPAGEKSNRYKVTDVLRIVEDDKGIPTGMLEKTGLTKYRYSGLKYPTFDKHRTTIEEIETSELEDTPPEEMELTHEVKVAEGMIWDNDED